MQERVTQACFNLCGDTPEVIVEKCDYARVDICAYGVIVMAVGILCHISELLPLLEECIYKNPTEQSSIEYVIKGVDILLQNSRVGERERYGWERWLRLGLGLGIGVWGRGMRLR